MAEAPHNGPRPQAHDQDTLSPSQAAEVLGVSKGWVLQLLHKRELHGYQDPDTGRWKIPRVHVEDLRKRRDQEKKPTAPVQPDAPDRELVEALKDQIADLRERLDRETEANRENRRIIAALTSRIPELPAPQEQSSASEPRESPQSPGPGDTPTEPHEGPQTGPQRPWWRRLLEG